MSMCMCERCDKMIDSDDDPECFIDAPEREFGTIILCEWCRNDREAQLEADAQHQAFAEQQAMGDVA